MPEGRFQNLLPVLGPVVFLVLWSGGFIAVRIGLLDVGPLTFLVVRYLVVLAVLVPLAMAVRPALPAGRSAWGHLAVTALLIQVLYFALINFSLELRTSAAGVALIVSLQPILVALAAPKVTGERVGVARWTGLALGLAGAAAVIVTRGDIRASPLGVLAAVAAACAITAGTLYEQRFGSGRDLLMANLVQYGLAFLALLPLAYALEGLRVHATPRFGLAVAYLAVGNSLISITLLLAMVRRGEAARVSALFFLVPPLAGLMALALLGESIPPVAWVGMGVAAAGVMIATRRQPPSASPARRGRPWNSPAGGTGRSGDEQL
ncbi:MAG: EamA family transporter [Candidatus Nephthysia bennettiae]|uniref:DMT family transporter n=1 Tax=Candidatus Nephthysia bennettiae TaxID=3127016 RepID=A0A934JX58_9BACT|nr:DMT family transporter [Candidatus Dormibacteraeota bacterium]MBJ7610797.1 DMT family transporter [Candidatus Dormibacteraeota bacterium]PZR84836.1 MAG: EamA family transporter [Candidatus Dormibacteraeota bacterium]